MKKTILLATALLLSCNVKGENFNVANNDVAALVSAIIAANNNSEADIINLAANGVYDLTAVNNTISNPNIGGGNGLPAITNSFAGTGADITINGNGATIQRNTAGDLRLLVIAGSGTEVIINNVVFKNAKATLNGAAIAAMWQKVKLTVNDCVFENNAITPTGANTEDGGGAILIHEGFLTITNSTFKGNTAPNGGAIKCLLSNMTLINCIFENNRTTGTGNNGGAGVIVDGAFNDSSNPNTYNPARSITIQQCKFLNNTDIKQGGGLFLYTYGNTNATIDKCYFKGNSSSMGGGLWAMGETGGTCTITNSTFDSNVSSGAGGGIATIANGGQTFILNITNSTLAFNQANGVGSGGGGGLFNANATVAISNSTIAKNSTNSFGGGIAGANGITIKNSIIADNTATNNNGAFGVNNIQRNCGSDGFVVSPPPYFTNGGNNLEWPIRTDLTNNGLCTPSMTVADPKLDDAVKDNGGSVPTLAILAGSAAIDAGNNCISTDQRGTARNGNCDIGAFEFSSVVAATSALTPQICTAPAAIDMAGAVPFGDGTPSSITQATLQTLINTGGKIVFNGGAAPVTLTLSATLMVDARKEVIIDGLGLLTISGNNTVRIFDKGAPANQGEGTLLGLQNMKLINGSTNEGLGGAAIRGSFYGSLKVHNVAFENNQGPLSNGDACGAVWTGGYKEASFVNCTFINNRAANGGAMGSIGSSVSIINCLFDGNQATGTGGTSTSVTGLGGQGGAVYTDGVQNSVNSYLNICGSVFKNSTAGHQAGALNASFYRNQGSTGTIDRCTFDNNNCASAQGGAMYLQLSEGLAPSGTRANGNFLVTNCTFNNNRTPSQGGAGWVGPNTITVFTNCTFNNNRAVNGGNGLGGGLAFTENTSNTITNCTFAYNRAGNFAASIFNGGNTTLRNTLFYENLVGIASQANADAGAVINKGSSLTVGGGNLQFPAGFTSQFGTVARDYWLTNNVLTTDAQLQALADNGGPTPTMALPTGSPAINAGIAAGAPATDQRGLARTGNPDIGAFEFGSVVVTTPVLTASPTSLSGFSSDPGTPSAAQSYALTGSNLGAATVTVTAPSGYELSAEGGAFATALVFTPDPDGTLSQTVSVRLTGAGSGTLSGSITHASATNTFSSVSVSGTVGSLPVLTVSITSLSGFSSDLGKPSAAQSYTLTGSNLGAATVTATAPASYELSTDGFAFAPTLALVPNAGGALSQTVQVRLTGAGSGTLSGSITHASATNTFPSVSVSGLIVPLPVRLVSFRAVVVGDRVSLGWETTLERNASHFTVERSGNGRTFEAIGRVAATGDTKNRQAYGLFDALPLPGINYYRLHMVDRDDKSEYSTIVSATLDDATPAMALLGNPVSGGIIRLAVRNMEGANYQLRSLTGQVIGAQTGIQTERTVELRLSQPLPAGVYLLEAQAKARRLTLKVVVN